MMWIEKAIYLYLNWFLVNNILILVSLKDILSDRKVLKLRWECAAKSNLLPIPCTRPPFLFLGKEDFYCHQGKYFNLNEKEKHFAEKNNLMKSDHIWKRSKPNKQPTKRMNCPVKFGVNISIHKIKSKKGNYRKKEMV